jgi:3-hydroxyacyl-[acyl-carrier-protein] dehydratase
VIEMVEKTESTKKTEMSHKTQFNIHEIREILPHRYPFLLVDRVTHHDPGKTIKGYKNVSANEPFFEGHFPDNPIMPGVLIVEAMAQLGCILVSQMDEGKDKLILFAGIDGVRFRRPVLPGDRLDLFAELLKLRGPIGKAYGKAYIDGELASEGEILFTLVPKGMRMGTND